MPESFRSAPESSGTGFSAFSGSNLNRYQVVPVGGPLPPGQMTASVPHEMTTVCLGTPKTTYFGLAPATELAVTESLFAGFVLKRASRDVAGPAISFFVFLSKRYHSPAPFSLTSDCCPASSE